MVPEPEPEWCVRGGREARGGGHAVSQILAASGLWLAGGALLEMMLPSGRLVNHRERCLGPNQVPIVHGDYDITAAGLERLHPFDSRKYGRVARFLMSKGVISKGDLVPPRTATLAELRDVHARAFLARLHFSVTICAIVEVPVCFLPASLLRWRLLNPMLRQAGGTIDAALLAARHGWGINLGGGFHHASGDQASGFCVYADLTMAVRYLQRWAHGAAKPRLPPPTLRPLAPGSPPRCAAR